MEGVDGRDKVEGQMEGMGESGVASQLHSPVAQEVGPLLEEAELADGLAIHGRDRSEDSSL